MPTQQISPNHVPKPQSLNLTLSPRSLNGVFYIPNLTSCIAENLNCQFLPITARSLLACPRPQYMGFGERVVNRAR